MGMASAAVQELSARPPKGITIRVAASSSSAAPCVARVCGAGAGAGSVAADDDRFTLDMTVDGVSARWELFFFTGACADGRPDDTISVPPDVVFVSDPSFAPEPAQLPSLDVWDEVTPAQRVVSASLHAFASSSDLPVSARFFCTSRPICRHKLPCYFGNQLLARWLYVASSPGPTNRVKP